MEASQDGDFECQINGLDNGIAKQKKGTTLENEQEKQGLGTKRRDSREQELGLNHFTEFRMSTCFGGQ